jgi:hypothetical protein
VGVYSEYLDRSLSFEQLTAERKTQLRRISQLRGGRDVLVFAADLNKGNAPIAIGYADLLPISDQLSNLHGSAIDVILETPGGSGEVAEDIVRQLHDKYDEVAVVVPGWAKSAGTIIAMAGDEILMEPDSALGPIDAQLSWQGKQFSAEALLEGFRKIKDEVTDTGSLNRAYIPILQGISPGELQSAENALDFARVLVRDWLARYKFKSWTAHSSNGQPVTDEEKVARANVIAGELCNHSRWLTHGRSIKISDLEAMRLKITDYSREADLFDAIRRYHTLLQMTFSSNIYKVMETPESQIYRFIQQDVAPQTVTPPDAAQVAVIKVDCPNCHGASEVQANLGEAQPLQAGKVAYPDGDAFACPQCGAEINLGDARRQIEAQTKKAVVTSGVDGA